MKEIDFLPSRFHHERRRRQNRRRNVICGVIIVAWLIILSQVSQVRSNRASDPSLQVDHTPDKDMTPAHGHVSRVPLVTADQRIEMIDRLQSDAPASLTIAEIGRCLDETTTTHSLEIQWRDELRITLAGTATSPEDIDALHDRLNACDFFDLVKLQTVQPLAQRDRLAYAFHLIVVVSNERAQANAMMPRSGAGS